MVLTEILKAFRETREPLELDELSRRLGTDRSAMEGMLGMLVQQGKLKEVTPGSKDCEICNGRKGCKLLQKGSLMGKVYELAEKPG